MKAIGAKAPASFHVHGIVNGAGLSGTYDNWFAAAGERDDETIGMRTQSTVRRADGTMYAVDENGNVRELHGLLLKRQRTQDFVDDETFTQQAQYDTFKGPKTLEDGRAVIAIVVQPPGGLPEEVDLDAKSAMVDRVSYDEADGIAMSDYYDYKVFGGALVPQREVDSNGDHAFDLHRTVTHVSVDGRVPLVLFDVPKNNEVRTDGPVTVKLVNHGGHYFAPVTIHGHQYTFLVDTGAQAIVLDSRVAQDLGLTPEGRLEVTGAQRVGGLGIAALDQLSVGPAVLPLRSVSVLDLHNVTRGFSPDGVLGYPFFASAEVQFDAAAQSMTFARPGQLPARGKAAQIDVDREMIEMQASVNGVDGRFILDTGNSAELLLYNPFMQAHPNLIPAGDHPFANSFGVGGAAQAVAAYVDELDVSGFRFFNRLSNVMLSKSGAFADRFDAGNIGMGVLDNFIVTFDVANAHAYFMQSQAFDDGRTRSRSETLTIPY